MTLAPIDGETLTSSTTMSNNYYGRNGLTYAAAAGWDSPSFFPIGIFVQPQGFFLVSADAARFVDLNVNVLNGTAQTVGPLTTTQLNLLATNGIWYITSGFTDNSEQQDTNAVVVGNVTQDEPSTTAIAITNPVTGATSVAQDGRFWHMNGTWVFAINSLPPSPTGFDCFGQGNGPPPTAPQVLATTATTPGGHTRHIEMTSTDNYWFAGARSVPAQNFILQGGFYLNYGIGRNFTADEAARACRYGDIVDFLRASQTTFSIPMGNYIENGGPYTQNTTAASYIQPPELNAAVWAAVIHGARHIIYFNQTFAGPAGTIFDNFAATYFQTIQAGQSISIYNQAKTTNAAVRALASVINAPFALGYVTVSPAGWTYGTASWPLTGFDVMAKWWSKTFYIFALPRYSTALTNQTATFTIPNTGASQVIVLNENRTIALTGGGTQFTDNFADGNTVHIYQVLNGVLDEFNRANGALGANWTNSSDLSTAGSGNLVISANAVIPSPGGNHFAAFYSGASFSNDQYAQVVNVGTGAGGPLVRHQGTARSSFYAFLVNAVGAGSSCFYFICTNGTFTQLGATLTATVNPGSVLRLRVNGTTLIGSVDGVDMPSRTDATWTSGFPGLDSFNGTFDSFQGGNA